MLAEDYQNSPEEVAKLNREPDELLAIDISGFHQKEQAFINRLQKRWQNIFTFRIYPNVPPDNNGLGKAIRKVKVKTKVSDQFRNPEGKGSERFARIRSVIDTALKNDRDVFFALKCMANMQIQSSCPQRNKNDTLFIVYRKSNSLNHYLQKTFAKNSATLMGQEL
jgi:hypothetical protein